MTDASDFLMGGGITSAFQKDDPTGTTITGQVVNTEVRQQTDIQSGQALTWDNGDPRMQLVVTLQTDQRTDEDDDGKRAIYVKGSKSVGSKSMHDAVRAAITNAGAKGLEPGGTLTVRFIGTEPSKTRGFNDRKLWEATYKAPDLAAATGDFLNGNPQQAPDFAQPAPANAAPVTPPAQAPAPQVTPAVQQAPPVAQAQAPVAAPGPAAAPQDTPVNKAKQLKALGITDDVIAAQLGVDISIVPVLLAS